MLKTAVYVLVLLKEMTFGVVFAGKAQDSADGDTPRVYRVGALKKPV